MRQLQTRILDFVAGQNAGAATGARQGNSSAARERTGKAQSHQYIDQPIQVIDLDGIGLPAQPLEDGHGARHAGRVAECCPPAGLGSPAFVYDDRLLRGRFPKRLPKTPPIPYAFDKCEETDRISNFEKAAGLKQGKHEGIYFNDSDVYKIMEGAAYSLQVNPDAKMRRYLDNLIKVMAVA